MIGTPEAPRGPKSGDWRGTPLDRAFAASGGEPNSRLDQRLGRGLIRSTNILPGRTFRFREVTPPVPEPSFFTPLTDLTLIQPEKGQPRKDRILAAEYHPINVGEVVRGITAWLSGLPKEARNQVELNFTKAVKLARLEVTQDLPFLIEKARENAGKASRAFIEAARSEEGGVIYLADIAKGIEEGAATVTQTVRLVREHPGAAATVILLPPLIGFLETACTPRPPTPAWITSTPQAGEFTPTPSKGEVAATPTVRQQAMLYSDKGVVEVTPDLQSAMVKYNTDQVNRKLTPYMESNSDFVPDYKTDATGRTYKDYSNYSLLAFDRAGEGNQLIGGAFFIAKGQLFYALSPDRRTATITVPDNTPLFFWDPSSPDRHFRIEIPSGMTNLVIRYDGPKNQLIYDFLKDNQPTQVIVPLTGDLKRIGKFSLPPTPPPPTLAPSQTPTESPIIAATRQSEENIKAIATQQGINLEQVTIQSFNNGKEVVSILHSKEDRTKAWYLVGGSLVEVRALSGTDHFKWDFQSNSIGAMTTREGKEFTLYWRSPDSSWSPWWIEKPGDGSEIAHFADGYGLPFFYKDVDYPDEYLNNLLKQAKNSSNWDPILIAPAISVPPNMDVSQSAYNKWRSKLAIDTLDNNLVNQALDQIASYPPDIRALLMSGTTAIKIGEKNRVRGSVVLMIDSLFKGVYGKETIPSIILVLLHEGGIHGAQSFYRPYIDTFKESKRRVNQFDYEFQAYFMNLRALALVGYDKWYQSSIDFYTGLFVNGMY